MSMTRKQILAQDKARHIQALGKLAAYLHRPVQDPQQLYQKLRHIETKALQNAVDYCNGHIDTPEHGERAEKFERDVSRLFGCDVPGLHINGDPRGAALSIEADVTRALYAAGINLDTNFGGAAILAPDFKDPE